MSLSENDAQKLDAALIAAPFVAGGWKAALEALATGSSASGGQLIGISPTQGLVFHVEFGFTTGEMQQLEEMGGYIGEVNPRIGAFAKAPIHAILSEPDFVSSEARRSSALYEDLLKHLDADLSCISRLSPCDDLEIGMCVTRPDRLGDYSVQERFRLRTIMPKLDAAIRLHLAVEQAGAQAAGTAFDTLHVPAFLFDRRGVVIALSRAAEQLAGKDSFLRLRQGMLSATHTRSNAVLQEAVARACGPGAPLEAGRPVLLRHNDDVLAVEVAPVPRDVFWFGNGAAAILVGPREMQPAGARFLVAEAFGLTAAETDIALALAEGTNIAAIAARRGSSLLTVRGQVKTILAKAGARSQAHLAALIGKITRL